MCPRRHAQRALIPEHEIEWNVDQGIEWNAIFSIGTKLGATHGIDCGPVQRVETRRLLQIDGYGLPDRTNHDPHDHLPLLTPTTRTLGVNRHRRAIQIVWADDTARTASPADTISGIQRGCI